MQDSVLAFSQQQSVELHHNARTESCDTALTILDYYSGKDKDFDKKMMKNYWFEKLSPWIIKRFWAHHRYFLFIPES